LDQSAVNVSRFLCTESILYSIGPDSEYRFNRIDQLQTKLPTIRKLTY